ncbi:hypothetical protein BSKO_09208 [Bryopsis sp. KO-2023]|nr:hypothetical protein BSKO_09208 [Bryopsis sp. KO-2023]
MASGSYCPSSSAPVAPRSATVFRPRCAVRCSNPESRRSNLRIDGWHSRRDWSVQVTAGDFETKEQEGAAVSTGEDYYAILGLSPGANHKEIKKAYYNTMRDFHPDVSTDEDATEFCIFLNEIYETLTDPEKRAAYDEIAGFDVEAINPFKDTSYPRDQVFVDEFSCIGCKNCCNVCASSFAIEDLFGRARVTEQGLDPESELQEAIDTCPVNCIHWVTAPQLTLLETQMAKIERVSAYIVMMGAGGGADVFQEAYTAFEKRQAAIRARKETNDVRDWMHEVGFEDVEWKQSDESVLKRRATAAKAAASARRWRDYQRRQDDKETLALPAGK